MISKDDLEISPKPAAPAAGPPSARPPISLPHLGVTPSSAPSVSTAKQASDPVDPGLLVIGERISFFGEIGPCKRFVVEGRAEAKLENCEDLAIAETGLLKGQICVESAEVNGRFEGELVVRKRLLIRAKGYVSGTVTYGELEIERGGRVVGAVESRESGRQNGGW